MDAPIADLVIGSGPNGFAAALALASLGRPAVLMDFGSDPEVIVPTVRTIASKPDARGVTALSHPRSLVSAVNRSPLPLSSARGGLSLIWGAAVLERSAADCPELGPAFEGIDAGYDLLRHHVDLAGEDDRLSVRFPWRATTPAVPASRRFARLRDLARERDEDEVLIGGPRVAMRSVACTRCGLCLAGCPEGLFFDAGREIARLIDVGSVRFTPGPALSLRPVGSLVAIRTPKGEVLAERVYLAAGPVGTPALLQRSRLIPDTIDVQDSAVFYVPIINRNAATGDEHDYTAAQLLAASRSQGRDEFTLAVYESNPDFRERLARVLRVPAAVVPFPSWIRTAVNAGIGFLSPERSGNLRLRYAGGRTWVTADRPEGARRAAKEACERAGRALRPLGLHPIARSVIVPDPGVGFHSGGALPLGQEHLDWDGRLRTAPTIRIVDATALPRIWAGSHTYTAMANAIRTVRTTA